MPVSVYAGPLLGYYVAGHDDLDRQKLVGRLEHWFGSLQGSLGEHLTTPLELTVDSGAQHLSRQLPTRSLDALRLLAAYAECSDLDWPTEMPTTLAEDPAWQRVSAEDFGRCHFPQIQIPDFWLCGDFTFTARQAMPDGDQWVLGSLDGLFEQLTTLNQRTLQFTVENLVSCADRMPELASRDFLALAEHALVGVLEALGYAREVGGLLIVRDDAVAGTS